ncbi:MAG TPA: PhzF family phenazine biosynthesis protein [Thermoanaerobaculia bacterium]
MRSRFVGVDVFADRPFAGNPLAVFPESAEMDDGRMQSIAREMEHAATAFLHPTHLAGAAFRLRVFSREREIPFAGYAALGAHFVHALETKLPLTEPVTRVSHEGHEGLFGVELKVAKGQIVMLRLAQRLPETGPRMSDPDVTRLARALGLAEEDVQATNQPVRVVSTGLPVLLVPVATFDALEEAQPHYGELRELLASAGDATLIYAFTKETRDAQSAAHARAFDVVASREIAAAGAAAGALSAYLVAQSAVTVRPVTSLVIEQGHSLSRPSKLFAEVQVKEGRISQVSVGGRVIRMGEGVLEV